MTKLMQMLNKLELPMPGERVRLRSPMVSLEMDAEISAAVPYATRYRTEARFGTDVMVRGGAPGVELEGHLKNIRRQISETIYGEVRSALIEMLHPVYELRRSRDREVWDQSDDLLRRIEALLEATKP